MATRQPGITPKYGNSYLHTRVKRVDEFTRDELQVSHDRKIERYPIQHVVTEDLQYVPLPPLLLLLVKCCILSRTDRCC